MGGREGNKRKCYGPLIGFTEPNDGRYGRLGLDMFRPVVQNYVLGAYLPFRCRCRFRSHWALPNRHSLITLRLQILFLNKEDLFRERIQYSPIRKFFPVRYTACFTLIIRHTDKVA